MRARSCAARKKAAVSESDSRINFKCLTFIRERPPAAPRLALLIFRVDERVKIQTELFRWSNLKNVLRNGVADHRRASNWILKGIQSFAVARCHSCSSQRLTGCREFTHADETLGAGCLRLQIVMVSTAGSTRTCVGCTGGMLHAGIQRRNPISL